MKIITPILLLMCAFILGGCDGDQQRVPRQKPFAPYKENPVAAYCGLGCDRCHQSQEECLRLLQENLPSFCDNTKQNCYDLWVVYAERCRRVCSGR